MILLITSLIVFITSCSGLNNSDYHISKDKSNPIVLTIWINSKDSYIGPDEQRKPQEDWYISKALKRFENENPRVKVQMTVITEQAEAHNSFKATGMAHNSPDIANLWSGQYIFALKDVILSLDGKVPNQDLENLQGWESVKEGFQKDGKILGYPSSNLQLCFFLYNKNLVTAAGLDFDNYPPRTINEFDYALERIKMTGLIPISVDEHFPYFLAYIGNYWWIQNTGIESIMKSCEGKSRFVDDDGFIDAMKYYHSLYKRGFINKDALTSVNSWNRFLQGKACMTPAVSSVVNDTIDAMGEKNIGVIKPPDMGYSPYIKDSIIGGPGQCLVVSKNSKNPEIAVKLMSFLNSKNEIMEFQKIQAHIPLRKDITLEELKWKKDSIAAKLLGWSKNYTYWIDNSLTWDVMEGWSKMAPHVLVGKITPKSMAEAMDKKMEGINNQRLE